MKRLLNISVLLLTMILTGCGSIVTTKEPALATTPLPKIVGSGPENYFLDEEGQRFFPWGLNYTSTTAFGLIDDDLQSDAVWHLIEEDFAEMKEYSANAVRIHLQFNRFMLDQWTPNTQAFEMLDRLVDVAEKNHLYLIITGLGAYRKEDSPLWYDNLTDEERWDTQALFWKTLAAKVGHRGAVFAYDLMNEPVVSVCAENSASCEWLVGKPFGEYSFAQNITREPGLIYSQTMAAWIQKLTEAIRSEDPRTLITVGTLSIYPLAFYADHLDFVSPHTYPRSGELQKTIDYILSGSKSKPIVLGEIFNLHCTPQELSDFLFAIDGKYQGLFGHYNGKTLEELSTAGDLKAMFWHEFLLFFMAHNPNADTARPAEP